MKNSSFRWVSREEEKKRAMVRGKVEVEEVEEVEVMFDFAAARCKAPGLQVLAGDNFLGGARRNATPVVAICGLACRGEHCGRPLKGRLGAWATLEQAVKLALLLSKIGLAMGPSG